MTFEEINIYAVYCDGFSEFCRFDKNNKISSKQENMYLSFLLFPIECKL